jgi:hypothetical protein
MINNNKEKILCAAIWYNDGNVHEHSPKNIDTGYVMCGRRHHNIIALHFELTGKPTRNAIQGFITSEDRFVNRMEAECIAYEAGQVSYEHYNSNKQLYSEDLY